MKIGHLNYPKVFSELVNQVGEYIVSNKLKSTILGISGGIDSTIVACILKEASVKYNFENYGILLPSSTSKSDEQSVAELVAKYICNKTYKISITDSANKLFQDFTYAATDSKFSNKNFGNKPALGNIKSRIRMIHLYTFAAAKNGIVIGTDNQTEYLLGFNTIGGDGLYDLNPIFGLFKTEIYELAEYLLDYYVQQKEFGITHALDASIKLIPQDGLGISNSDMDQIGCKDYYEVDKILQAYLNNEDLPKNVGNVIQLFNKNSFKRNHPIKINRNESWFISGVI